MHLESLLEDEDLHRNIKRPEFEELIKPLIERLGNVLAETLILSGKCLTQLKNKCKKELLLFYYMSSYLVNLAILK